MSVPAMYEEISTKIKYPYFKSKVTS